MLKWNYFHNYLLPAFIFPPHSLGALICFSTPHHHPPLAGTASSPLLSISTIISSSPSSSSCTCSIVHCSTPELCKEKTDYLLSCKITTRLVCWPGQCLGDKQKCLLFSHPKTSSTFSWLLVKERLIGFQVVCFRCKTFTGFNLFAFS